MTKLLSNFCRLKFVTLNNRRSMKARDMHTFIVLLHCTSPQWDLSAYDIQDSSWNTFWVILWTKFKYENQLRASTPKVWCLELWFLCIALLLNEIYLPMKFHVDALYSIKVMLRTKKGRTDKLTDWQTDRLMDGWRDRLLYRQTDESITICHPSEALIISIFYWT